MSRPIKMILKFNKIFSFFSAIGAFFIILFLIMGVVVFIISRFGPPKSNQDLRIISRTMIPISHVLDSIKTETIEYDSLVTIIDRYLPPPVLALHMIADKSHNTFRQVRNNITH